jgi:hypothetical protein
MTRIIKAVRIMQNTLAQEPNNNNNNNNINNLQLACS